jgi:uncharacterized protein
VATVSAFFALAIAFTWVFHGAMAASAIPWETTLGQVVYRIGLLGPLLAALLMSARVDGVRGVRDLLARAFDPRCRAWWFILALGWVGLFRASGVALHALRTGATPDAWIAIPESGLLALLASQAYVLVAEEVGWRAFALPPLIALFGPLGASLLLGTLWSVWHVPMFFHPDLSQYGTPFVLYALTQIAWSIAMTFLYLRSGSILVAMLFHVGINVWFYAIPAPAGAVADMAVLLTLSTAVVVALLPRPLVRWPWRRRVRPGTSGETAHEG